MPDVLGPLSGLAEAAVPGRESIEALRARTSRRRRRRRVVAAPVLVIALAGAGALLATARDGDGGPQGLHTVDDQDDTSTTSTSTSTTVTTSVAPGPNPLAGVRRVVSGPAGIVVLDPVANPPQRRLTDEPTLVAYGVGDGLIVAQHGDPETGSLGTIVSFDGTIRRELVAAVGPGGHVKLLDARLVGGRPLALVSSTFGADPETYEVRLSKLYLDTGEEDDLGVVGGWEEGVQAAQLLSDGDVVFQRHWIFGANLERRSPDGTPVWTTGALDEDSGEGPIRTMVVHDAALVLLEVTGEAQLHVRRFGLETGEERPPATVAIAGDDLGIVDGLCSRAVHSAPGGVLCTRSYDGGPLLIDLTSGRASAISDAAPERSSAMTVWRDGSTSSPAE